MSKFKFFVTDWAPNGTNGLIVRDAQTYEPIEYFEEAVFGVNVMKLGKPQYFDMDLECPEYRVSKKMLRKHIAVSPVLSFEENCKRLSKYLK